MSSVGEGFGTFFGPGVAQIATPQGAAAVAEFIDTANPGLQCVPFAPPVYMILPGFRSIEIRGDSVVIRGEDAAVDRVVHLGVANHDGVAPSVQGHSIGRWDGGVLIVDTASFAPHRIGNGAGLPGGARKHLVERFALAADGGLTYSYELEDPEYLKERVTGHVAMGLSPRRRLRGHALRSAQRAPLPHGIADRSVAAKRPTLLRLARFLLPSNNS
jgi:hypothetical protein